MTQEYVPGRAPPPPMTPSACLQQDMARAPIAPTSPPGYHGGMQAHLEHHHHNNLLGMGVLGLIQDKCIAVHHMLHRQ